MSTRSTRAWFEIQAVVEGALYPVEVLPAEERQAKPCLSNMRVTTASWQGAVVLHWSGNQRLRSPDQRALAGTTMVSVVKDRWGRTPVEAEEEERLGHIDGY
jgi:hypothetical protein